MKKVLLFFLCATMFVWIEGNAFATSFTETWQDDTIYAGGTGEYMEKGDWITLGFDFLWDWQEVEGSSTGLGENFYQSADVEYALYEWQTGWIDVIFWSGDSADEDVSLNITSFADDTTQDFGTFDLDDLTSLAGSYWALRVYLNSDQLSSWSDDPYGSVKIEATNGNLLLTSVSMTMEPVPEPTTMLLFGSGIVGLIGFRKKFRKV